MEKFKSIFKMIGSQSARLKTASQAISYIFNGQKTSPDLCISQYLDLEVPVDAWDVHPMHHTEKERQFIHAMLCPYGKDIPSKETLKKIVKNVMQLFNEYPVYAAIHTDRPKSPHIHLLIHPRNIITDKVWQQTPAALKEQKRRISSILEGFGLYGINTVPTHTSSFASEKSDSTSVDTYYNYQARPFFPNSYYDDNYADFEYAYGDEHEYDYTLSDGLCIIPSHTKSTTFDMMHPVFKDTNKTTIDIFTNATNGLETIDLSSYKELLNVKKIN